MSTDSETTAGEELDGELAALLDVERFEPPAEFRERALLNDPAVYEQAAARPAGVVGGAGRAARLVPALDDRCSTTPTRRSTSGSPAAR